MRAAGRRAHYVLRKAQRARSLAPRSTQTRPRLCAGAGDLSKSPTAHIKVCRTPIQPSYHTRSLTDPSTLPTTTSHTLAGAAKQAARAAKLRGREKRRDRRRGSSEGGSAAQAGQRGDRQGRRWEGRRREGREHQPVRWMRLAEGGERAVGGRGRVAGWVGGAGSRAGLHAARCRCERACACDVHAKNPEHAVSVSSG